MNPPLLQSGARHRRRGIPALAAALALAVPAAAWAAKPKDLVTDLDQAAFFKPELYISSSHAALADIQSRLPNAAAWEAFLQASAAGDVAAPHVYIDPRSGAATNIIGAFPIIPGSGVGNTVTLSAVSQALGRPVGAVDSQTVADLVRRFVLAHKDVLGIDARQLGAFTATQVNPDLWQVTAPQQVQGVPVRYGRLAASVSHGNLVVIGTENWGNARLSVAPEVGPEFALAEGFARAGGRTVADLMLQEPALEVVPVAPLQRQQGDLYVGEVGAGYEHRLVWSYVFQRPPEDGRWEVVVDAHSGEVLSLQDINHYVERRITGGVYPITSTEICPSPLKCGTMQPDTPMPFADTGLASPNNFTNSAGIFNWTSGTATTTLTGRYVDIVDNCGAVNNSSTTGDILLGGTNGQHDCTNAGGSSGNTASARSAFYEINKIAEMARGYLPSNTWLQSRLTTNVNINNTCNGFWNGSSVNFYRSGGGCRNTGELAGVFDHEWGHGLDDFDAAGTLSNSSEGYADIAAIYRYQDSCVGHGFFWTLNDGCGQTADGTGFNANEAQQGAAHCDLDCSGVRDADYLKHSPNTPDTALGYVCTSCISGTGPCGRQVHCAAAPTRQAAWDLVARDLTTAPFSYDSQSAFIVGNKLFYQGSGNVGAWHACTCGSSSSGCGATNGYMQWITADDNNGNLSDGTPHMTAIFNAFNRHGIACSTPTAQNSTCTPTGVAVTGLTATAGNYSVALSWSAASGATRYWVFRTEGHAGCNYGKALIAETTSTSYTDTQVANGRTYYYNVVPAGSSSACYGRAGTCVNATPSAPTNPDFSVSCSPSSLTVTQGSSTTSTCTVTSINGFSSAVSLACGTLPSGSSCSFSPASVTPPANGTANSTLTVSATAGATTGTFAFQVNGTSGATTRSAGLSLTVNPSGGGGAQTAVFDATLQAPRCSTVGTSCDTGASLVLGRGTLGPEPNQPNTINDSCADGSSGTFHSDESNDRILVATTDGSNFAPGKTVRITATVWAWSTPSADRLDLYYAANASSPAWTFVATLTPTVAGSQTLSATYTLPTGSLQAVRARFRYQGSAAACGTGSYNDHDDLVFAVGAGAPDTTPPTTAITAPAAGSTVSGTVNVTASASDNVGVTRVEFYLDGALQSTDTTSPYAWSWNTTTASNGSHTLQSRAYDAAGNVGTSANVGVTVNNTTAPDVTAVFDAGLQAPRCSTVGKSCTAGTALLNGRDGKGPEPNQPNTINDSCADGTSGTYHVDESNDALRVETVDGTAFGAGKQVRITATVYAWSTGSSDRLDLYYAANANSPTWTFIGTFTPPGGGVRTMTATYTLPSGTLQAIRAQFRYSGSASSCTVGGYNDRDDLVFAVQ
jgi:hypothetical protein